MFLLKMERAARGEGCVCGGITLFISAKVLKNKCIGKQILAHPCSLQHDSQQPKCGKKPKAKYPLTDNKQMWSIHTEEYYSALKRKEILTPATNNVDEP